MVEKKKTAATRPKELAYSGVAPTVAAQLTKFDIAAELARARTRAGMSQSQLAERSGVSRNTLMGYESGRNKPGARELKAICEVLHVTPNRMIFGTEDPFKKKSTLEELGVSDEDLESAKFPVMLNMLARDERDAVLTLVQNLLEARHGENFKTAMKVLEAAMSAIRDGAEPVGKALHEALDGDAIQKLSGKVEASIRKVTNPPVKVRKR